MSVDLDFITTRPMPFKALDKKTDYISREVAKEKCCSLCRWEGTSNCEEMEG